MLMLQSAAQAASAATTAALPARLMTKFPRLAEYIAAQPALAGLERVLAVAEARGLDIDIES